MRFYILALLGLALGACAGVDTPAITSEQLSTEPPYVTLTSDHGEYRVAVRTAPEQPPSRGVSAVEYTITDPQSHPQNDLQLTVVPWMPAHGHGTSGVPSVSPQGKGKYLLTGVNFFMPGRWDLRTTIAASSAVSSDQVAPSFDIP